MQMDKKKVGLALLVVWGLYASYHVLFKAGPPPMPVPKVVVRLPKVQEMADYVTQTGTMVAYNSVNLVARVEGYLERCEFEDGSMVKKDQLLFVIQPEPYLEKLKAAKALVVAQKSVAEYDVVEYERQQRMYKQNATSLNNVQKWLAKSHESAAQVDKRVADEQIAAINYSYTHVKAPFDGRIGRHLVDPGNLVGNGEATKLATLEQLSPIYVYFNLNELDLIRVRQAAAEAGITSKDINQIPVYVAMQNEEGFPHEGRLDYVNTGLNASTGTMEFRGILSNQDVALLPGMFVQVRVATSKPKPLLTVPETAIQYDQIGAYVFTVDDDNIVHLKRIKTGPLEAGWRGVVDGLTATDRVVVDGLQNAIPDNKVDPKDHVDQGKAAS